ncbi:hypothetical protein GPECTOR_12g372 [Gonium pectorale]|uniref:THO complex subunit 2 n=1 Tax=Gonium pectorale TaxID=33097 RepID=A0A150GPZ9_GONPE|nr:hypothetical protein GPECTOR_12g372 [Gonium pectorale]|eukprot:KXZ51410.1 hypothetical protein GPECTOR_12g372 [Gonium pectorale]
MTADIKPELLSITLKHIQGRVFEADEYYKALEPLGPPASYAEALVDVFWMLWVRFEVGRGPESMNLVAAIKACWQDKRVPEKALLQVLEPECLHSAGLVRDKAVWDKKAVRYNTKLNYTILKYNLLREDSEGYAKLVTLYNHFGAGAVTEQDLPVLARELHSLIGCFDLDPNRCLDLLLDAAAAAAEQQQGQKGGSSGSGLGLLSAVGLLKAEAVGQLMGFKLQQYQDPSRPPAPRSLLLVAAELVRRGAVSLPELLSHLAPSDEAQAAQQRAAREALAKRVGDIGQINLGGAAALEEGAAAAAAGAGAEARDRRGGGGGGGSSALQTATGRATGLSAAFFELGPGAALGPAALGPAPQHNQPLALLDALLQVGAWDAACELHERLVAEGAAPAAHGPISAALCRLLEAELAPAYAALFPQGPLARNALWGDVPPSGSVPPALSPSALRLLGMLGVYVHRDVRLFTKVIRLVRFQLAFGAQAPAAEGSAVASGTAPAAAAAPAGPGPRQPPLEELLSGVLLPAVACCPVALPLAAELWECIKLLPVAARFRIYADFRDLAHSHPLLQAAWRLATVETKKVLKRLVLPTDPQKKKEAPHARMVAKVAHANPMPVMEAIIEVYDNQIEVSLEALKYLSPFSYDMLTFVILSRLALERDKVKEDGVNISGWLQALARFTGAACRRFSDLDVGAVLQFLVNTLRAGDAFDLLVLQQIIVAMTGVRLEAVLSDEQLDALSGGPELVAEAVVLDAGEADAALGMGRTASAKDLAKGRQRLLRALEDPDGRRLGGSGGGASSLTLPLLVLTAQQRSIIINHTDSKLIKFIATMYDRCQETLLHLTEFLRLALPVEAYADMLPGPDVLRREYGIDVEAVWHIYRPVMARLLDAAAPQPAEEGELEEGEDGGAAPGPAGEAAPREEARVGDKTWSGVLSGLPACAASPALWTAVTPELYATFWSLQLTDIYAPTRRYEKELSAVKDQLASLESRYLSDIRPGLTGNSGYVSNAVQEKYEAYKTDKAAAQEKQSRLSAEFESRRRHVEEVRTRLSLQRASFFLPRPQPPQQQQQAQQPAAAPGAAGAEDGGSGAAAANGQKPAGGAAAGAAGAGAAGGAGAGPAGGKPPVRAAPMYHAVVQEMLLPRLLFSATDALYCARLMLLLHSLEAKHFSLIMFLDSVLRATVPTLRSMTEVEANNFGVFLFELLKQLVAWHRDEKLFTEECVRKVPALGNVKQPHHLFKSKMIQWHGVISATFRASIESGDYTQIANALSVMGRLVTVWPGTIPAANSFRAWVEKLQKDDPREDIKTMARSYLIALGREADKPGRMMSQLDYGGPQIMERQKAVAAAAQGGGGGGGARGGAPGGSPPGAAAKGSARQGAPASAGAAGGSAAADGGAGSKSLNVAAKPFVPGGGAAAAGGGGADAADGGPGRGGAAGAARKRPRAEGGGRGDGDKGVDAGATDGAAAGGDKPPGGAADGGSKKQRTEAGGTAGAAAAARGGDGGDTVSEAGGRAGSETSGRDKGDGREGRPEKEHKEHKRSKDKDREKDRSGKDKDKDKERKADKTDKEHREDKDESRREEKERRREEKERERAEKGKAAAAGGGGAAPAATEGGREKSERGGGGGGRAGDKAGADAVTSRDREARAASAERPRAGVDAGAAGTGTAANGAVGGEAARDRSAGRDRPPRDRNSGRRSGAPDDGADRDGGDGGGGAKRRRTEGKGDGGGSPGQAGRGGSATPDVGGGGGARRADSELEYDERGGFALPPVPAPRGGGTAGSGAAAAARGSGGGGGGGLPPPARSNGTGEARRRSGR